MACSCKGTKQKTKAERSREIIEGKEGQISFNYENLARKKMGFWLTLAALTVSIFALLKK